MSHEFDPYHKWLGIPPSEQPPNHYRLLGVVLFEADREVIEASADRQMAVLRQMQSGMHGRHSQKLLNEVARARACLLDPNRRAAYDAKLGQASPEQPLRHAPAPARGEQPLEEPQTFSAATQIGSHAPQLPPLPELESPAPDPFAAKPELSPPITAGQAPLGAASAEGIPILPAILIGVAIVLAMTVVVVVAGLFAVSGTGREDAADALGAPLPPISGPTNPLLHNALLIYDFEPETIKRQGNTSFVLDRSGREFDATLGGVPVPRISESGKAGSALSFAEGQGTVTVPRLRDELIKDRTQFTVAVWCKPAADESVGFVFDVGWMSSESITIRVSDGEFGFMLATRQGGKGLAVPHGMLGYWRHLAGTWDGKVQRFYVDGKLVGQEATTIKSLNPATITSSDLRLGITAKNFKAGGRYYHGLIDELVVLPRALSAVEVQELYQLGEAGTPLGSSGSN